MVARLLVAFSLVFLAAVPAVSAAGDEKPPLTISIVADPLLRDRFDSREEFEAYMLDLINRASLIFNADVGKRLVPGAVEVGLPPNAGFSIEDKSAFAWLGEKQQRRPSQFWIFLIDRPLASCHIPGIWGGCALMNESRSIVAYNSDLAFTLQNLLHEMGHNCGANHSESKSSIMHPVGQNATSYGDKAAIIREKCG